MAEPFKSSQLGGFCNRDGRRLVLPCQGERIVVPARGEGLPADESLLSEDKEGLFDGCQAEVRLAADLPLPWMAEGQIVDAVMREGEKDQRLGW